MFSKWLPLIRQLTFGWDTITGMTVFGLLSFLFGETPNVWVLMAAGFCAYVPDLDFIWFLLLRKRLNISVGHWVLGHFPPLILPLVALTTGLITSMIWPGHVVFMVTLATTCTTLHFVHDAAANRGGFHLLAPFTRDGKIRFTLYDPLIWAHYEIGWWGIRIASHADTQSIYNLTAQMAEKGDGDSEVLDRTEPVTKAQFIAFGICITGLFLLILKNGFQMPF